MIKRLVKKVKRYYILISPISYRISPIKRCNHVSGYGNNGVSKDGRHFYTLNGNQGTVSVFKIKDDGSLDRLQVAAWTNYPFFGSHGLAVL
jgi:6-phosphogluconolactonase (cycloisomerase 2 family)